MTNTVFLIIFVTGVFLTLMTYGGVLCWSAGLVNIYERSFAKSLVIIILSGLIGFVFVRATGIGKIQTFISEILILWLIAKFIFNTNFSKAFGAIIVTTVLLIPVLFVVYLFMISFFGAIFF